eukprot:3761193-Pleurochrysis_carterae.AAC.8
MQHHSGNLCSPSGKLALCAAPSAPLAVDSTQCQALLAAAAPATCGAPPSAGAIGARTSRVRDWRAVFGTTSGDESLLMRCAGFKCL